MEWYDGELSKDVKEFLENHNKSKGWGTETQDLIEALIEAKTVWEGNKEDRRWWYECDVVVEIDGKFIMYPYARSTRDMSASESGWEMYLSCIRFVKPVEKTVIVYE
jgi:hypothetical protein